MIYLTSFVPLDDGDAVALEVKVDCRGFWIELVGRVELVKRDLQVSGG